jgi:ring-1,2-phenylacetyl-CoA epoxidase subunit PaaD
MVSHFAEADRAWAAAAAVPDPELRVCTIDDLGILRELSVTDEGVEVVLTPTYSGCPAMETIREDVVRALAGAGFERVRVRLALSPAWTTDWISPAGRQALRDNGIAPPDGTAPAVRASTGPIGLRLAVKCPLCGSLDTHEVSHFGSTACKALYVCDGCGEPFDHVKAL